MDEGKKRSIRNRRPPNYLFAESEDPQLYGYGRANYSKEYITPALELNSAAKLLSKFIVSVNRRIQEKDMVEESENRLSAQQYHHGTEKSDKKMTGGYEAVKKKEKSKHNQKDADRETKKSKGQEVGSSVYQKNSKIHEQIKKDKATTKMQRNQLSTKQGSLTNLHGHYPLNPTNKNLWQHQNVPTGNPLFKQKQNTQQTQNKTQQRPHQNKLFGRSSYHVAIAYHIHLNRVKEQGGEFRQETLDPTFHSKKMRGEWGKNQKDQTGK